MGVRVLLIPVLVWAFLFAGAPDARDAVCIDPPARLCSDCQPAEADGRLDVSAPCGFRCCCAPDRAPDTGPSRSPIRVDGPRVLLDFLVERSTIMPLIRAVARVEPMRLPARPGGRVLLAFHCIWQT